MIEYCPPISAGICTLEAPVMLQQCSPECSRSALNIVKWLGEWKNKIHTHEDADKQPACGACKKRKKKTLTSSCLHCWSVFYTLDSLTGCNTLPSMHLLISHVVLSSKSCLCLSLKAPQKEPVHYQNILTVNQTLKTTSAAAPAEDWFKPFHLISFPPSPPFPASSFPHLLH